MNENQKKNYPIFVKIFYTTNYTEQKPIPIRTIDGF